MENVYRNFYRSFYMRTGGFIPSNPLNHDVFPGDFFQVRNGEMIVLGNIFRSGIIDPGECTFAYGTKQNPAGWNFSDGLTKPYSGRGSGSSPVAGEFEFSRQILSFDKRGSFFFKGNDPESVKIMNWNELQQQLIIRLTQTFYSFRELYVVTESATAADWTLAIAGAEKAELEIATDAENFGLADIFGHHSAKTIQSKDIEYYHRETKRKPAFFKAKKLAVQDEKLDVFISELITERQSRHEWASDFYDYDFHYEQGYSSGLSGDVHTSLLDMLSANELNPNTALLYFKWADANLDDIENFFLRYGY
ncbi:MAG: hypothetical protein JWO44_1333 [Bacteroidetes bacterium]|jgi:hypothetical protein|nr:hypothetical protein [Bacteroidota bacterium]